MTSNKVQTSLRIDKNVLYESKKIFNKLGMNFSEAVNIFTSMVVQHNGLPFDVKLPNDETVKAIKDAKTNKNMTSYSLDEMKELLNGNGDKTT